MQQYCVMCRNKVIPTKNFSFMFAIFLGVFYLPYYFLFKKKQCPVCGGKIFTCEL